MWVPRPERATECRTLNLMSCLTTVRPEASAAFTFKKLPLSGPNVSEHGRDGRREH